MNRAILIGNLGKDPELRFTQNQNPVCSFSVATAKRTRDGEQTTWHNVVVWGKPAEVAAAHLTKGQKVAIEGEIVHRKYTDKNGVERSVSEIHVWSHIEFLSPKKERAGDQDHGSSQEGLDNVPF